MTDAMGVGGPKVWYTAAQLAELRLPGLSSAKRKINERAMSERWALRTDATGMPLARPNQGRGGGVEYHVGVLPAAAQTALAARGLTAISVSVPANDAGSGEGREGQLWSWFDQQPDKVKAEAADKLKIIDAVEALENSGLTATAAVAAMAAQHRVAPSSIWAWRNAIMGAARGDRLPRLAPQRKGGGREAEIDYGAWQYFLSDYLRLEEPTLASCYQRCLKDYATPRGLALPHQKTFQRKLAREVPPQVITLKRRGTEALRGMLPPQERSVAEFHALELVNIDGHRWDVFVRWPDGSIARPMMVAIQDVYSRKILAWRIGETESAVLTRLAFADLFRDYGIPKACLMDNGRAFASKWITGGVANRFRFKVKDEDPTGLLPSLGVKVHFATPYRGSSKPIERAFRDLCDTVAKHPAFAGAYTGNRPDAKPENYGSKAVDLDTFKRVVTQGIDAHNDRVGRRTEACAGRLSFNQAFNASYAVAPIGKATPEQLRMALLAADKVKADRKSGAVSLPQLGATWWSDGCSALAGQTLVVRFDPDDLTQPAHIYSLDGRFLLTAERQGRVGFLDAEAAKRRARQEAELRRNTRRAAELQDLITTEEMVAMMPDVSDDADETPEPSVIRPVRHRGQVRGLAVAARQTAPETDVSEKWMAAMERLPSLKVVGE